MRFQNKFEQKIMSKDVIVNDIIEEFTEDGMIRKYRRLRFLGRVSRFYCVCWFHQSIAVSVIVLNLKFYCSILSFSFERVLCVVGSVRQMLRDAVADFGHCMGCKSVSKISIID